LEISQVLFRFQFVFVEESIDVDSFLKIESGIVLLHLFRTSIEIYTIDLEKQDIRRSADPRLLEEFLARSLGFKSFNF
jgi:hypothetical protein